MPNSEDNHYIVDYNRFRENENALKELNKREVAARTELQNIEKERPIQEKELIENQKLFFFGLLKTLVKQVVENCQFKFDEQGIIEIAKWEYDRTFFFPSSFERHNYDGGYGYFDHKSIISFKNYLGLHDEVAFPFFQKLRLLLSGPNFDPGNYGIDFKEDGFNDDDIRELRIEYEKILKDFPYSFDVWNKKIDEARSPGGHGQNSSDGVNVWKQTFIVRNKK